MRTFALPAAAALATLVVRAAVAAPPLYKNMCDADMDARGGRCHGKILACDDGKAMFSEAPPANSLGATDLAAAYHLPKTGGNSRLIATQLGVHYPNAEADLAVYRAQYGLPPCTKANGCFFQVDGNGGTNYPRAGGCGDIVGESALDIDMLSAGCPDCKIMLIEPNGTSVGQDITMAIGKGAVGISFSWGSGEDRGVLNEEPSWKHAGTGLFAASGDSGFLGMGSGKSGAVSYPATSAGVVAVGGTVLKKSASGRGWDETAWNGGGSGCSTVIPKPAWQTDTGCTMRTFVDISAVADNVAMYCTDPGGSGGWSAAGGTSAASPFATGALAVTGVLDGHFDPQWVWQHADKFYDVTAGSNGTCASVPGYFCKAGSGYDAPTGVGSPNGDALTGTVGGDAGPSNDASVPRPDASVRDGAGGSGGPVDAGGTTTTSGSGGSATSGSGGSTGDGTTTAGSGGASTSTTSSSSTTSSTGAGGSGASSTTTGSSGAPPAGDSSGCSCKIATRDGTHSGNASWAAVYFLALTCSARALGRHSGRRVPRRSSRWRIGKTS
jgi:hypothetical protein